MMNKAIKFILVYRDKLGEVIFDDNNGKGYTSFEPTLYYDENSIWETATEEEVNG